MIDTRSRPKNRPIRPCVRARYVRRKLASLSRKMRETAVMLTICMALLSSPVMENLYSPVVVQRIAESDAREVNTQVAPRLKLRSPPLGHHAFTPTTDRLVRPSHLSALSGC